MDDGTDPQGEVYGVDGRCKVKRRYTYRPRKQDWQRSDIAMLRMYAPTHSATQIAAMLGRSRQAVYCKACELAIPLLKDGDHDVRRKYSDDVAREAVRRYFEGSESQRVIADSMGISLGNVNKWCLGTERPYLRKEFVK